MPASSLENKKIYINVQINEACFTCTRHAHKPSGSALITLQNIERVIREKLSLELEDRSMIPFSSQLESRLVEKAEEISNNYLKKVHAIPWLFRQILGIEKQKKKLWDLYREIKYPKELVVHCSKEADAAQPSLNVPLYSIDEAAAFAALDKIDEFVQQQRIKIDESFYCSKLQREVLEMIELIQKGHAQFLDFTINFNVDRKKKKLKGHCDRIRNFCSSWIYFPADLFQKGIFNFLQMKDLQQLSFCNRDLRQHAVTTLFYQTLPYAKGVGLTLENVVKYRNQLFTEFHRITKGPLWHYLRNRKKKNIREVFKLLKREMPPDLFKQVFENQLRDAVSSQNVMAVSLYLGNGTDPNTADTFLIDSATTLIKTQVKLPLFFAAIRKRNVEIVSLFLAYGVDPLATPRPGLNACSWAVMHGSPKIAQLLLSKIASFPERREAAQKLLPLLFRPIVARDGSLGSRTNKEVIEFIEVFAEVGIDLSAPLPDGSLWTHYLLREGQFNLVRKLIFEQDLDPHAIENGKTTTLVAALNQIEKQPQEVAEMIEILLGRGVSPNSLLEEEKRRSFLYQKLLDAVADRKDLFVELSKVLLEISSNRQNQLGNRLLEKIHSELDSIEDKNRCSEIATERLKDLWQQAHVLEDEMVEIIKYLLEKGGVLSAPAPDTLSPLTCAVARGYAKVVELLLINKADPLRDPINPLELVATGWDNQPRKSLIRILTLLLKARVPLPNAQNGVPFVCWAASQGDYDLLKCLIDQKVNFASFDDKGESVLDYALRAQNSFFSAFDLLLAHFKKNQILISKQNGIPFLFRVIMNGNTQLIPSLSEHLSLTAIRDAEGGNVCHYAVQSQKSSVVAIILKECSKSKGGVGTLLNRSDNTGITPLMLLCKLRPTSPAKQELYEIGKQLLIAGASVIPFDNKIKSAYDYAKEGGDNEMMELLEDYGFVVKEREPE